MKKNLIQSLIGLIFMAMVISAITGCKSVTENSDANIHHTVFFCFNDSISSEDKQVFFSEIKKLSSITGVIDLQIVVETGKKNSYSHGVTMMFKSQEDYNFYNTNPLHVKFVQELWLKQVEEFMEIDYQGTL